VKILRYAAFSTTPEGGNPAGVVLDAAGATDAQMQRVAAEVGYSETAFLDAQEPGSVRVRYFSPLAEVPFCGHATIASAVAHAHLHGPGVLRFDTAAGPVAVSTATDGDGVLRATLISVPPRTVALDDADAAELLAALGWSADDLDVALPPRVAYAGAWHPVLAVLTRRRLADLDYDFPRLAALMAARDWTTVALVHRVGPHEWAVRNPFPPGGVVEDPATGAAAAAFGGYLRELGLVTPPTSLTIRQGDDLGRPSVIDVDIPVDGGIAVSGTAVQIPAVRHPAALKTSSRNPSEG
jgi:PhzF family phenazine biosynthesis protein